MVVCGVYIYASKLSTMLRSQGFPGRHLPFQAFLHAGEWVSVRRYVFISLLLLIGAKKNLLGNVSFCITG
jgi:hypothetical protein